MYLDMFFMKTYRLPMPTISHTNLGTVKDGDTDNIHRRLHGSD